MPENDLQNPEELVKLFESGKAAIGRLVEENRRLATDFTAQSSIAAVRGEEAAALRAQLESRASEFERLQQEVSASRAESARLRAGWEEMAQRVSSAEAAAKQQAEQASNFELELEIKRNTVTRLHDHINRLMSERSEVAGQIQTLTQQVSVLQAAGDDREAAIREWERRFAESERKNDTLANLYLASFQLHSTLDLAEVITTLKEILINFIGAQSFAILLSSETKRGDLVVAAGEGLGPAYPREFAEPLAETFRRAMAGETSFSDDPAKGSAGADNPVACIPLATKNEVIGVLAIYSLLVQKERFTALDHQLFTLLSRVAATAILGAKLYAHPEGSVKPLRSFLGKLVGSQRKEATP